MRIRNFSVNVNGDYEFNSEKSICVMKGKNAELHLRLLGMMIGCADSAALVEQSDSPLFILHGDVEMGGKDYGVCFIYSKTEPHRVAGICCRGGGGFSVGGTVRCQNCLQLNGADTGNILSFPDGPNEGMAESEYALYLLDRFITRSAEHTSRGDYRPLFIFGVFDRLDESVDVRPYLIRLSNLGRQVFLAVGDAYPAEKLSRPFVQTVETKQ